MRIGILGYGSIGARHGQNALWLGHKVIYHDPKQPDGLPRDEVIKRSDAVIIASPTPSHFDDLLDCNREGKVCFVEKPISNRAIKGSPDHVLMVGYNMRFHPCTLKAAEWLKDERIGKPLWASFICAQYNEKPDYLRDGVTLNWSHEIDLALHLLGPAKLAAAAINGSDSIADITLTHETECQTSIHLDYVTRPEHRGFSVAGEKGVLIANLPQRSIMLLDSNGNHRQSEVYPGDYGNDYATEMAAFIDRVEGKEAPGCTAAGAIEVLKICLKAKKMAGL